MRPSSGRTIANCGLSSASSSKKESGKARAGHRGGFVRELLAQDVGDLPVPQEGA